MAYVLYACSSFRIGQTPMAVYGCPDMPWKPYSLKWYHLNFIKTICFLYWRPSRSRVTGGFFSWQWNFLSEWFSVQVILTKTIKRKSYYKCTWTLVHLSHSQKTLTLNWMYEWSVIILKCFDQISTIFRVNLTETWTILWHMKKYSFMALYTFIQIMNFRTPCYYVTKYYISLIKKRWFLWFHKKYHAFSIIND